MKILLVSHSPLSSTGYGRVVRGLAGSFVSAGHQVVCLGSGSGKPGATVPYAVIPWSKHSPEAIELAIKRHRPDVLLTVGDPWMFLNVPKLPPWRWRSS